MHHLPKTNKLASYWKTIEHLPRDSRISDDSIIDCTHCRWRDIDFDSVTKSRRITRCTRQRVHHKAHLEIHLAHYQRAGHWHCVTSISLRQIRRTYAGPCFCFKNSVVDFFCKFSGVNGGLKSKTSFMDRFFDRINFDLAGDELTSF